MLSSVKLQHGMREVCMLLVAVCVVVVASCSYSATTMLHSEAAARVIFEEEGNKSL